MAQIDNKEQGDPISDELRSIGRSMEQKASIENAGAPWRAATWVLGTFHALAIAILKTLQGNGATFDARWWGYATGSFSVYALTIGLIALVVFFFVGKLSKPATASRNGLIASLPSWWVFIGVALPANGVLV
jgi:hypothetical protein